LHDEGAHLVSQSLVAFLAESFFSANGVVEIGPAAESGDRDEFRARLAEALLGEVVSRSPAFLDRGKITFFWRSR